jgi:hypothetical protein
MGDAPSAVTTHPGFLLVAVLAFCALCVFLGFIWGKRRGTNLDGSPLGVWIGGAMSAFIGGFVEGAPIGSTAGGGLAGISGKLHADLTGRHLAIEAMFILAAPCLAGLADLRNFVKANSFPNIFLGAPPAPLVSGKPETAKEAVLSHENKNPESDPPAGALSV